MPDTPIEQPANIVSTFGDANHENSSMVVVGFDESGKAWVKHRNTFGEWTPAIMPDDIASGEKEQIAEYFGTLYNLDNTTTESAGDAEPEA